MTKSVQEKLEVPAEILGRSSQAQEPSTFEELLNRIRAGSEEAVWELLERYSRNVLRLVRKKLPPELRPKLDSIDIVQSVWKSFLRGRASAEDARTMEGFLAYLVGIAKHKIGETHRHYLRSQASNIRREVAFDPLAEAAALGRGTPEPPPANRRFDPAEELAEVRENWTRAMHKVGAPSRQVVQLRLEGFTLDEIADRLAISKSTVRRILRSIEQSLVA
jgi:RNA polymerase sigma-70 factor (ECF subfamily)